MFKPKYTITTDIAKNLMAIEAVKQSIDDLPITPRVLASLRKTARLYSAHYSTMIEGNKLDAEQVKQVLENNQHFVGRDRDEFEVKGYYAALEYTEEQVKKDVRLSEKIIQTIHAYVMAEGRKRVKATAYRDGQNVIKDGRTGKIVYMPPEAKDVSVLMSDMVSWINKNIDLPVPVIAAIAHYQFATIHPYYDGNGRTARLLTTLILHLGGYDLKGLYALEEYYAEDLTSYYDALTIGKSHNYYMGRADADITKWVDYFIKGMRASFESVKRQALKAAKSGQSDSSTVLRSLNAKQRKVLNLFKDTVEIGASDLVDFFGIKPRTATAWCLEWVENGFMVITNPSKKARRYALSKKYEKLL